MLGAQLDLVAVSVISHQNTYWAASASRIACENVDVGWGSVETLFTWCLLCVLLHWRLQRAPELPRGF